MLTGVTSPALPADLPRLLRDLRRRHARRRGTPEITYRELARRTGWSLGVIAGYFSGSVLPPTDRFDVLITLLDATPAERGRLATVRDIVQESRRAGRPQPQQLPAPPPRFTGRQGHLAELAARRGQNHLFVLSGPPGVGKTALALHWAHATAAEFPDGRLHADLRGFHATRAPADPYATMADLMISLGLPAARVPERAEAREALYRSLLAGRRALIVLDDARDAEQVRPLLPGDPGCRTVVTSRNPLTGLAAREDAHAVTLAPLADREAYDLVVRRLGTRRAVACRDAVEELVRHCGGMPLALVVAAARARSLRPAELASYAAGLRRLDGFACADPASDVRAVIATSCRGLSPAAARVFARLGALPEVIAAAGPEAHAALSELAGVGLVTEHSPGRWTAHAVLRAYADQVF